MECTISKKTQHSRRGSLYKTYDKEGYQRQFPDEGITLLDDSEDKIEGGLTSADAGTTRRRDPRIRLPL